MSIYGVTHVGDEEGELLLSRCKLNTAEGARGRSPWFVRGKEKIDVVQRTSPDNYEQVSLLLVKGALISIQLIMGFK